MTWKGLILSPESTDLIDEIDKYLFRFILTQYKVFLKLSPSTHFLVTFRRIKEKDSILLDLFLKLPIRITYSGIWKIQQQTNN